MFLLGHAKALLLIDNHQPQILEDQILLQNLVGADEYVDPALGHVPYDLLLLLLADEARQGLDPDRPVGVAVTEILEMLLSQERGRHQDRHLPAVLHGHEGRPHRHLGLAETHVAADHPVHGLRCRQILEHILDGGFLIGRFLERKPRGEGDIVLGHGAQALPLAGGALGVNVQQLGGDIAHPLQRLAPGLLPLLAAQLVQRRRLRAGAAVATDQVQRGYRHIELVLIGVLQRQEIPLDAADRQSGQAHESADAVILMHHG